MKNKLIWTARALKDLDIIYDFESARSATKANNVIESLLSRAALLQEFPETGQEEANLKNLQKDYRYLVVKEDYKLIYRVEVPYIYVTTVFDVRQDPARLYQQVREENK